MLSEVTTGLLLLAILAVGLGLVSLRQARRFNVEQGKLLTQLHKELDDLHGTWDKLIAERFAAWVETWVYDIHIKGGEPERVARAKAKAAAARTRDIRPRQEQP